MACGHLTDPPLPVNAMRFDPPAVYTRWWTMVESCSGFTRAFGNVEWYSAPGVLLSPDGDGDRVDGYWSLASNRIVLVADDTLDGGLVRHEMLHALVRVKGHPRSEFLQNCGGVVGCGPICV